MMGRRWSALAVTVLGLLGAGDTQAQEAMSQGQTIFGFQVSLGGRYDDVRMCVATPAGVKGGPAMDISFFVEVHLAGSWSLKVNVPVVRPILFGAAFGMLQFEPDVTLLYRATTEGKVDVVVGPSLGLSLHYGPDFHSSNKGEGRGPAFFALGPRVGGYVGLDFKRADETFNFQLGVSPYLSPLFGIADSERHRGIVVGGMLDGVFRFQGP